MVDATRWDDIAEMFDLPERPEPRRRFAKARWSPRHERRRAPAALRNGAHRRGAKHSALTPQCP